MIFLTWTCCLHLNLSILVFFFFLIHNLTQILDTRSIFQEHFLCVHGIFERLDESAEVVINICHLCMEFLQKGKLPRLSIANEFDFGKVPSWLPELTIVEECLIALCRARLYILKLSAHNVGPPSTAQRALKGHCICFPQDTEKIFNSLPHNTIDLGDVIQIVFLSANASLNAIQERMKQCKILIVRRRAVEAWLEFLCKCNRFYADVVINKRYFYNDLMHFSIFFDFFDFFDFTNKMIFIVI